jgi:hypothetical protein
MPSTGIEATTNPIYRKIYKVVVEVDGISLSVLQGVVDDSVKKGTMTSIEECCSSLIAVQIEQVMMNAVMSNILKKVGASVAMDMSKSKPSVDTTQSKSPDYIA